MLCVVAIGKESAVARTGLKTIDSLVPGWDLSERHIILFLNLSPCHSPEGHIEIRYPRHIYFPKSPLTTENKKKKAMFICMGSHVV